VDDPVDETVLEEELGALEAWRELLGDRAGRDASADSKPGFSPIGFLSSLAEKVVPDEIAEVGRG